MNTSWCWWSLVSATLRCAGGREPELPPSSRSRSWVSVCERESTYADYYVPAPGSMLVYRGRILSPALSPSLHPNPTLTQAPADAAGAAAAAAAAAPHTASVVVVTVKSCTGLRPRVGGNSTVVPYVSYQFPGFPVHDTTFARGCVSPPIASPPIAQRCLPVLTRNEPQVKRRHASECQRSELHSALRLVKPAPSPLSLHPVESLFTAPQV
jgi:hypothetical protein